MIVATDAYAAVRGIPVPVGWIVGVVADDAVETMH